MSETPTFVIRTYAKCELAHLYCPGLPIVSALKIFKSWIERHPTLEINLMETGYKRRNRYFSPKQVELILDCLGEP